MIPSKAFGQDYALDQLNNWPSFNEGSDGSGTDDITQTRTMNLANEITQIDSASTYVSHDAAGNMTTLPQPGVWNAAYELTWDAWNRLVAVSEGKTPIATYEYDGLHRRIVKNIYKGGEVGETQHYYLSVQAQVLETRLDAETTADKQYTWGTRYVDDLVLRTRDLSKEGTESLYALQDETWDIVALCDGTGAVVERFLYDPYGKSKVLDPNFTADSDGVSDYDWDYRFTTQEWDGETSLHYFNARYYHDQLGRFVSRDPLGYVDGGNLYAVYFVPQGVDPWGMQFAPIAPPVRPGGAPPIRPPGTEPTEVPFAPRPPLPGHVPSRNPNPLGLPDWATEKPIFTERYIDPVTGDIWERTWWKGEDKPRYRIISRAKDKVPPKPPQPPKRKDNGCRCCRVVIVEYDSWNQPGYMFDDCEDVCPADDCYRKGPSWVCAPPGTNNGHKTLNPGTDPDHPHPNPWDFFPDRW